MDPPGTGRELPTFDQLPYPVALTARRMTDSLRSGGEPLKSLFALKDCFEATIKYLGVMLLTDYFSSSAYSRERSEAILERLVQPSLGDWVSSVVRDLSDWLIVGGGSLGRQVATFFMQPRGRGSPTVTELWKRCKDFVGYRNDALVHGATPPRFGLPFRHTTLAAGNLRAARSHREPTKLATTARERLRSLPGLDGTRTSRRDGAGRVPPRTNRTFYSPRPGRG